MLNCVLGRGDAVLGPAGINPCARGAREERTRETSALLLQPQPLAPDSEPAGPVALKTHPGAYLESLGKMFFPEIWPWSGRSASPGRLCRPLSCPVDLHVRSINYVWTSDCKYSVEMSIQGG